MQRRLLIVIGLMAIVIVIRACATGGGDDQAPASATAPETRRILTPEQLLHLVSEENRPLRLRSLHDVLPGDLSAVMAPMIIDWQASEVDRPDGFVVVNNLNYGGNPVEGTTVLQSVKVPLDGLERVEFVLVPLAPGGRRAPIHHGMLRFVFREDRPLQLLDLVDEAGGGDADLRDLLVSWEAWRPPGVDYDVMVGMDPAAYALSLRLYAGPQRFLEDALSRRDWYVTPLRLPGGGEGPLELLKVALAMGDGVARHTISERFAATAEQWLAEAPVEDRAKLAAQWRELGRLAAPRPVTDDPRVNIPGEERTYQSALRSCATVAYYNIVVAVDRLAERGLRDGVDFANLDRVSLGGDEPWMAELADASLGGIVARAPEALRWLRSHPFAVPERIPGRLDKAGLVRREQGKAVMIHYTLDGMTPYGAMADNLIR